MTSLSSPPPSPVRWSIVVHSNGIQTKHLSDPYQTAFKAAASMRVLRNEVLMTPAFSECECTVYESTIDLGAWI